MTIIAPPLIFFPSLLCITVTHNGFPVCPVVLKAKSWLAAVFTSASISRRLDLMLCRERRDVPERWGDAGGSALCAGASGGDDMNHLQGFWRLSVWVESSGFSRGTDGFNTDCMGGCSVKAAMPEHEQLLCPLDGLPRENRRAASEVVGTLTGPHAWRGFSSGSHTNRVLV